MLEIVRKLLRQKPYHPFRVVMKSGARFEVDDPERMAISLTEIHWFQKNDKWVRMKIDEIDLVYTPRK